MTTDKLFELAVLALTVLSYMILAFCVLSTAIAALSMDRFYFWMAVASCLVFYFLQSVLIFLGGYYGL